MESARKLKAPEAESVVLKRVLARAKSEQEMDVLLQDQDRLLALFDFGLQQPQPLPLDIQSLAFQTLRDQLRAIQMQQADVECPSHRQWFELASLTIFAQVISEVVSLRMQHKQTGSRFFRRRPVITFVHVAAKAGVDQVRQIIRAACG